MTGSIQTRVVLGLDPRTQGFKTPKRAALDPRIKSEGDDGSFVRHV